MPIRYRYKTKAEIPAAHVDLYIEKDGEFILDAEGAADAAKLAEFRDNNKALLKALGVEKIDDAKAKLEKLKDVDPDRYKELTKAFEDLEQKKLETKGEYEKALSKQKETLNAEHKKVLDTLNGEVAKLQAKLAIVLIDDAVSAEAIKKGVRDTALTDVKARARGVFKLDGDKITTVEENKFGKGGEPLQIGEWVESLLTDAPHLFDPSKGSGAGGGDKGGGFGGPNPYELGANFNLTKQSELERTNPALAKTLQAKAQAAGKK